MLSRHPIHVDLGKGFSDTDAPISPVASSLYHQHYQFRMVVVLITYTVALSAFLWVVN